MTPIFKNKIASTNLALAEPSPANIVKIKATDDFYLVRRDKSSDHNTALVYAGNAWIGLRVTVSA